MNIFEGHFGIIENYFRFILFENKLVLGFGHPHFKFQINLDMMHGCLCNYLRSDSRVVTRDPSMDWSKHLGVGTCAYMR